MKFATYLSGSGSTELVFAYTVRTVDDDPDGIWWGKDSLQLDVDDSITGVGNGQDATLDHSQLGGRPGHRIDQSPRALSQEVTSAPSHGTPADTYGAGDAIIFEVVFNQAVTVTGEPRLRISVRQRKRPTSSRTYVSGERHRTRWCSPTPVLPTDSDDRRHLPLRRPTLDYPVESRRFTIVGFLNNVLPLSTAECWH